MAKRKHKKCRAEGCERLTLGIEGYCTKHRGFSITRRFNALKQKARRLNTDFNITLHDYELIIDGARCEYCSGKLPAIGHGLDRIDSDYGYTKDNVTPCCYSCNMIKGDRFTYTQMKILAEFIREMDDINWIRPRGQKEKKHGV